ncbi:MAG: FecR family protein [Shinella sp.]|nr:FecR family protein [Shinella sp.]
MTSRAVREEAVAWFVRMNSGEASPADEAGFQAWLCSCPENKREYARLQRMWSDLDHVRDPSASKRPNHSIVRFSRRHVLGAGAMAAAATAIVWVGGYDYLFSDQFTGTGEVRELVLDDGTHVTLDADSAISVDYSPSLRRLVLQRGRAYFDVAGDETRPFSVFAREGSVTALGTQFVVQIWDYSVTASVQESAVSVALPDAGSTRLEAGETLTYGPDGLGAIEPSDAEAETSWRRGRLIFEDKPLARVISDVNRYRRGTIRILDAELRNLRVSGIFDVNDPDGVLDAIVRTLPVRSLQITPYVVLLLPA